MWPKVPKQKRTLLSDITFHRLWKITYQNSKTKARTIWLLFFFVVVICLFYQVKFYMSTKALSFQGSTGDNPLPKLSQVVVSRIQFIVDSWTESHSSSPAVGQSALSLCHMVFSKMAIYFSRWRRQVRVLIRWNPQYFVTESWKWCAITFLFILFISSESLGLTHTREKVSQGHEYKVVKWLGPMLEAANHSLGEEDRR